MRLGFT